jgi:DNA helicase-2/ATP-dependent DNA helicase PcrA
VTQKNFGLADKGYRYGEIAILARLYRLMPLIEATMIRNAIPYSSVGGFFYERQDMKTAIAVLKFLLGASPGDALDQKFLNLVRTDLYAHHEKIDLRAAFEVASTYVMLKRESEYLEEDAQILKRTYLDALEYLVTP